MQRRTFKKTLSIEIPPCEEASKVLVPRHLGLAKITSGLYISSYAFAKNMRLLKQTGITHILNLAGASRCRNLFQDDFVYASLAIRDSAATDLSEFIPAAVAFIQSAIENGGKVLIHCFRGKSRAPAVACAYLIEKMHLSTDKALRVVKKKQPFSDPNFGFISQLQALSSLA